MNSDELESFHKRLMECRASLSGHRNFARNDQAILLATFAREWLRLSGELREEADGLLTSLEQYDSAMEGVLKSTKSRTRTNVYHSQLEPFKKTFLDDVVFPVLRHEGSPSQAAARKIKQQFIGVASEEELVYIEEASRCCAAKCHRAAIIMLWTAAVARFHAGVQLLGFKAYNDAAASISKKSGQPFSRVTKGLNVSSLADLQIGRDFDLISIGIELWQYDIQAFEELNRLLGLRNSAAHPGSFEPTTIDVRQYADRIQKNAFGLVAS